MGKCTQTRYRGKFQLAKPRTLKAELKGPQKKRARARLWFGCRPLGGPQRGSAQGPSPGSKARPSPALGTQGALSDGRKAGALLEAAAVGGAGREPTCRHQGLDGPGGPGDAPSRSGAQGRVVCAPGRGEGRGQTGARAGRCTSMPGCTKGRRRRGVIRRRLGVRGVQMAKHRNKKRNRKASKPRGQRPGPLRRQREGR